MEKSLHSVAMSEKKSEEQKVSGVAPFGLRLLPELKERVARSAKAGNRSLNAEITYLLEYALDSIELYNASSSAPLPDDSYIEKELSKRHIPTADGSDATTLSRKIEEESKATQMALGELSAELARLRMKIIDVRVAPKGNEFTITRESETQPDVSPFPLDDAPATEEEKLEFLRQAAERYGYKLSKK